MSLRQIAEVTKKEPGRKNLQLDKLSPRMQPKRTASQNKKQLMMNKVLNLYFRFVNSNDNNNIPSIAKVGFGKDKRINGSESITKQTA